MEVKHSVKAGRQSWLFLCCETQLGPWPVALGLGVDGSKGQVDARAAVMVLLSHLMLRHTNVEQD